MTPSTARKIDSVLRPGDCGAWAVRRFAAYSDVPAGALKFLQAARLADPILPAKRHIYRQEKAADEVVTVYDGWPSDDP